RGAPDGRGGQAAHDPEEGHRHAAALADLDDAERAGGRHDAAGLRRPDRVPGGAARGPGPAAQGQRPRKLTALMRPAHGSALLLFLAILAGGCLLGSPRPAGPSRLAGQVADDRGPASGAAAPLLWAV